MTSLSREYLENLRDGPKWYTSQWTAEVFESKYYKYGAHRTCHHKPLGIYLTFADGHNHNNPEVHALEFEGRKGVGLEYGDEDDPFFEDLFESFKIGSPHRASNQETVMNRVLSAVAQFMLARHYPETTTETEENNMPINAPKKRISPNVNTKSAKAAIMDGAKTAAASTVADRIRRLLTKRLENTPLQPVIAFIPDDVLNFLFAMAVSTAADYAPGVPKRDAVKRTAMFAVEGSSHDAIKALTGFLADLFGEIVEECADVLKGVGEE